jgi:hypothetical protein
MTLLVFKDIRILKIDINIIALIILIGNIIQHTVESFIAHSIADITSLIKKIKFNSIIFKLISTEIGL